MKPLVFTAAALAVLAAGFAGTTSASEGLWGCAPGPARYATIYELDAHGVIGELWLVEGGQFELHMFRGDRESMNQGCWSVSGDRMAMVPRGRERGAEAYHPEMPRFDGMVLRIAGEQLVWDMGNGRRGVFNRGDY